VSIFRQNSRYMIRSRIPPKVQEAILAELDRQARTYHGVNRRQDNRMDYRPEDGVWVKLTHPTGLVVDLVVVPRDISRRGISFLHGSFVHIGTRCVLNLQSVSGEQINVSGSVLRCHYLTSGVHEVTVKFDGPISLNEVLCLCSKHKNEAKSNVRLVEDKDLLSYRVLYVEDSADDRQLARHIMTQLGIQVYLASNGDEALKLIPTTPIDMVLTDVYLPGMSGLELAERLRSTGFTAPIVMVTADESHQVATEAMEKGCDALLTKPYSKADLKEILSTHLNVGGCGVDSAPLFSTKWSDAAMQPIILEYLGRLEDKIRLIEQALAQRDMRSLDAICLEIKGSAEGYGFAKISRVARELHLGGSPDITMDHSRRQIDRLVRLCRAACSVRNGLMSKT